MMKDVGNFEEARRAFERAARRAIRREAAEACHDLFAIALELGQYRLAERHLRKALSLRATDTDPACRSWRRSVRSMRF